ncbi:MAG: hypothetical protein JSU07_01340 [Bacteroidetes bacterium]|nr:hypothetical protein [Bacteroidota bacterium]
MKKTILILTVAITGFVITSCGNKTSEEKKENVAATTTSEAKTYTCPMHPEVISDKPGTCPKCGMDLVEKENTEMDMNGKDSTMKMK